MAGMGSAERRWRTRVADQRASGLSVKAFCAARGIAASSLFAWRRRLALPASLVTPSFVEVSSPPSPLLRSEPSSIELELRSDGRRVLILRRGFDPALLRDVLAAMEGEAR